MRKMFSEKQIENIAQQVAPSEEEIKDLAWESVSVDHATDLVEPIIDTVNYGIQEGLIEAGGIPQYQHSIAIVCNNDSSSPTWTANFSIIIYSNNNTPFTKSTFITFLQSMTIEENSSCYLNFVGGSIYGLNSEANSLGIINLVRWFTIGTSKYMNINFDKWTIDNNVLTHSNKNISISSSNLSNLITTLTDSVVENQFFIK